MCADDTLETVADSIDDDIVVAGPSRDLRTVEARAGTAHQPRVVTTGETGAFADAVRDVGVVVVAIDGTHRTTPSLVQQVENTAGFVVTVFSGHTGEAIDPALLDAVSEAADVTLLACGKQATAAAESDSGGDDPRVRRSRSGVAVSGALDFVRMIHQPGQINLDLADAQTVLSGGSLGVLAGGTASLEAEGSRQAVNRAFADLPPSIETTRDAAALVSVAGDPAMSVADATATVQAVREQLGTGDELIWGVTTDDTLRGRVTVDIVVEEVTYRPPLAAGDPCRRCDTPLSAYTYGDRTELACEECGFADLPVSLGDGPSHDRGF